MRIRIGSVVELYFDLDNGVAWGYDFGLVSRIQIEDNGVVGLELSARFPAFTGDTYM